MLDRVSDEALVRLFRLTSWLLLLVAAAGATELVRGDRGGLTSTAQLLGFLVAAYWLAVVAGRAAAERLAGLARSGILLGEPAEGRLLTPYRSARGLRLLGVAVALVMLLTAGAALASLAG